MDYTTVTESPGNLISSEAMSMLYTRYRYAAQFCEGKEVLEVACGAGQGLGFLGKAARRVFGGDYTENLLRTAQQHYNGRIPLARMDAQSLPFRDSTFDVVLLYEAIYYLQDPGQFLEECRRILRTKGTLLICTVNKEWRDFNSSPFSKRYFSSQELSELLQQHHFHPQLWGAFPVGQKSLKGTIISFLKRMAVNLRLIPKTMKGKQILKRFFLGKLVPLQPEITEGMAEYVPPKKIPLDASSPKYKVLYVSACIS